ncbi:hypothetical protein [Streptomyces sp. RP5T]|uniref:hypothetical protein n=1 Tax=Streptomyces sp. RP5T TaxID=2490848 RepID=UPI000F6543EC|nr:hypothetical protein [Streptomyces sp. RP5T]RRR87231.1 hypothetical protein EHS43_01700 [Streptomyces sp. RP5T]
MVRDEGEAYAARLQAADVPITAVRHLGVAHDFMTRSTPWAAPRPPRRPSRGAAAPSTAPCTTRSDGSPSLTACPGAEASSARPAWPGPFALTVPTIASNSGSGGPRTACSTALTPRHQHPSRAPPSTAVRGRFGEGGGPSSRLRRLTDGARRERRRARPGPAGPSHRSKG